MKEGGDGDGLQTLLYLQVRKSRVPGEENFEHNWHVIDESTSCISEDPRLSAKLPRDTISAFYHDPTSGPTIFLCGGRRFFTDWNYQGISSDHENPMSPQVWSSYGISDRFSFIGYDPGYDYNGDNQLWCQSRSMNVPRTSSANAGGCALVVDKVLYVFGGVPQLPRTVTPPWNTLPWAEFYPFDGGSCYWSPLEPPLDADAGLMPYVSACFPFKLDMDQTDEYIGEKTHITGKSILVYFHTIGCIYALLLDSKQWTMVDPLFGTSFENLVFLADINILLAAKDSVLYAYDLLILKWFQDPVKGLDGNQLVLPMLQNQDQPHSFHLVPLNCSQGNLCMLWTNRCDKLSPLHVSCMKFTVYRKDSSVVADSESTKEFTIAGAEALVCCLPLKLRGPSFNPQENDIMDCDSISNHFELLKDELHVLDKDQNGFVTAAELRQAMTSVGEMLTDAEFDMMLGNTNVDGNRPVNYKDLFGM